MPLQHAIAACHCTMIITKAGIAVRGHAARGEKMIFVNAA
jgi:hypothetical protein